MRISPDGRKPETLADGLRNPNGLAVGPTASSRSRRRKETGLRPRQSSKFSPAVTTDSADLATTPDRPLGYDPPLCWISRQVDNSSGGQVWVTSNAWNPLVGQLLHFSYGRCTMLLTLRETIDSRAQGAVVPLPVQFDSGAMRGRFHPRDGQLYVTGLKGWVSSAAQDGCFQRSPLYQQAFVSADRNSNARQRRQAQLFRAAQSVKPEIPTTISSSNGTTTGRPTMARQTSRRAIPSRKGMTQSMSARRRFWTTAAASFWKSTDYSP